MAKNTYQAWWKDIIDLKNGMGYTDSGDGSGTTSTKTLPDRVSELEASAKATMMYRGTVATQSALPTSGNKVGDFWNVTDTGKNFAWNGSAWDDVTGIVSASKATLDSFGVVKLGTNAVISEGAVVGADSAGHMWVRKAENAVYGAVKTSGTNLSGLDTDTGPVGITSGGAMRAKPATTSALGVVMVSNDSTMASTSDTVVPNAKTVKSALDTKANLASPALTGTPTAPTAATATNNTQVATTAYVKNNLSSYAPKANPTFTGTATIPTAKITTGNITTANITTNKVSGNETVGGTLTVTGATTLKGALSAPGLSMSKEDKSATPDKIRLQTNASDLLLGDRNGTYFQFDCAGGATLYMGSAVSLTSQYSDYGLFLGVGGSALLSSYGDTALTLKQGDTYSTTLGDLLDRITALETEVAALKSAS